MKSVKDFNVRNMRILLRCDFNVPLGENDGILDDTKIKEALPTINYLTDGGAKIIIITHLGDGQETLDGIAQRLGDLLGKPVKKIENFAIPNDQIVMLENIRSHKEEAENSEVFAKKLALLGDIYINEAFDVCHRAHASVVGIPKFLPHGAGFLLQKEVGALKQIIQRPARPVVAIIGGAKSETKAKYVGSFAKTADWVIIGGLIKKQLQEKHSNILENVGILGPEGDLAAPDINEKTIRLFEEKISQAKTVFWNGPLGKFEQEPYDAGTRAVAKAIVKSGAYSVAGGAQTLEFLRQEGMIGQFSHVSTAGGAMLSYLAGEDLPGLTALEL